MIFRALSVCLLFAVLLAGSPARAQQGDTIPPANNPPTAANPASGTPPPPVATTSPEDANQKAEAASSSANQVETAVAGARDHRKRVERCLGEIKSVTEAEGKPATADLDDLRKLDRAVVALEEIDPDPNGLLTHDNNAIDSAEQARSTACTALNEFNGVTPEVSAAKNKCSEAQRHAAEESTKMQRTITAIQPTLQKIYAYEAKQVRAMADRLEPLNSVATEQNPAIDKLLQTLPANLPILRQIVSDGAEYQLKREHLNLDLTKLGITPPAGLDESGGRNSLQTAMDTILPKLAGWFQTLASFTQDTARQLDSKISAVETDPARNSTLALDAIRNMSDQIADLQSIADAWPPIVAYFVGRLPSITLKTTRTNFEAFQSAMNALRGAISRLNDALAGDVSKFETDQVSLYYFTDVKRLMYALNPSVREMGGVAEAQEQAAVQRKRLSESEFELADAQANVNRYQKEVLDLQEQQRQIQAKLKGQDSKVSSLASRLKHAQREKAKAASDYSAAQNASDNPSKVANIAKAKAKDDAEAAKESEAQSDYDSAKADRDATQNQLDASKNDSQGLPAKIEEAKQALSSAQTAVAEQRRKMLMAAQAESDAFAIARDNTPFLFAPAVASSTDPAKRVVLYAFNDSKTIFMRGKRADLAVVKGIIAEFDTPAPQARLTLWTFELNSDSGQKTNKGAADALNRSMEIVDQELGDTRALVNTTLALLRDLVNQEVSQQASQPTPLPDCEGCNTADKEKLNRLRFYDPLVLKQLNFDVFDTKSADSRLVKRLVPDPAGTTTLGETLLILSLARPDVKRNLWKSFEEKIKGRLKALPVSPKSWPPTTDPEVFLPLTWQAMGIWDEQVTGPWKGLSSSQLEIVRALRAAFDGAEIHRIADQASGWYDELNRINPKLNEIRDLQTQANKHLSPIDQNALVTAGAADKNNLEKKARDLFLASLTPADRASDEEKLDAETRLEARRETIRQESVPFVNELQSYGFNIADLSGGLGGSESDQVRFVRGLPKLQALILQAPALSSASPRVAAADEMLKEMIIAIEDDLDRLFIQPMIVRLRKRLTAEKGVRVGILQRESMLATNRGKARIDPRASAQLAVGDEQDILSGVQQLAQLYTMVQSGGVLAAAGALQVHLREPQPEIVALTTGNKFEVTPIFDPSGQALRFKFDFVGSSKVQEPNGSTNPQFPRIERHTVNTEIQLSNLETREISRFETNSRLGRPTQYSGGFPVLKDIPYVRPWVPLVGWFVRKGGTNGAAQQSVIFGQTTIYPTIGTMIDLLSDTGLENKPKAK